MLKRGKSYVMNRQVIWRA